MFSIVSSSETILLKLKEGNETKCLVFTKLKGLVFVMSDFIIIINKAMGTDHSQE